WPEGRAPGPQHSRRKHQSSAKERETASRVCLSVRTTKSCYAWPDLLLVHWPLNHTLACGVSRGFAFDMRLTLPAPEIFSLICEAKLSVQKVGPAVMITTSRRHQESA